MKPFYRGKSFKSTAVILVVLSAVLIGALYIMERAKAGRPKDHDLFADRSIFNSGTSGTMALWEYFTALGLKPEQITEPLVDFYARTEFYTNEDNWFVKQEKSAATGVMLCVEPGGVFSKDDVALFEKFADGGFTVMIFTGDSSKIAEFIAPEDEDPTEAPPDDGFKHVAFFSVYSNTSMIVKDFAGIFKDIKKLDMPDMKRFTIWNMKWDPLVIDSMGTLALERKIGKGHIVLVSDSEFLSNLKLREGDNGAFIYRMVSHYIGGGNSLYFDEYHHGIQGQMTIFYFIAKPEFRHLIVQAALFLLAYFFAAGLRFGRYRYPKDAREEKIYYYSEGMAGLLGRRRYAGRLLLLARVNLTRLGALLPNRYPKAAVKKALEGSETGDGDAVVKLRELVKIMNEQERSNK
ncbi:MAG: hypothetical protein HPY53_07490 [Brevinematales bacterium]|nr:hypothetical protein [Brevinematales bacterium]